MEVLELRLLELFEFVAQVVSAVWMGNGGGGGVAVEINLGMTVKYWSILDEWMRWMRW